MWELRSPCFEYQMCIGVTGQTGFTVFAVAFQKWFFGGKEAISILTHLVHRECFMRLVVPYPGMLSLGRGGMGTPRASHLIRSMSWLA